VFRVTPDSDINSQGMHKGGEQQTGGERHAEEKLELTQHG